jgi:hypothetical protein
VREVLDAVIVVGMLRNDGAGGIRILALNVVTVTESGGARLDIGRGSVGRVLRDD